MTREEAIKVLRKSIDNSVEMTIREWEEFDKQVSKAIDMAIEALSTDAVQGEWEFVDSEIFAGEYFCSICGKRAEVDLYGEWILSNYCPSCGARMKAKIPSTDAVQGWIPLLYDDNGLGTNFPYERDGEWVIVTDGKTISVERIKKDVYDHFFPNGRWFELEDVIAWQPLPQPYKGGDDE